MKYIYLIFTVITFVLSGCGSSKPQVVVKTQALPSWYTNPPLSTSSDLYALGEGRDKKEAIAEALSFMASTLSVSISSKYNAKTEVREGKVNSSDGVYKSNIQSNVQEMRISSYELIHAKSLGFKRYAVVIKSNKRKLFTSMLHELEQKFALIKNEEKSLENANALEKLSFYKKKKKSLESLPNTLLVLNVLNPAFEDYEYIRQTQEIATKYHEIRQKISFSIKTNSQALNLKAVIAKAISEKMLKIKEAQGAYHFTIYIKSEMERTQAYGFWLARSNISITTKDYKGTIVASNTFQITGQSSQSFIIAKQDIAFRLNALIKKETISSILALDI